MLIQYVHSQMILMKFMMYWELKSARNALINEITDLISDSGTYVNSRHIELLADTMTQKGGIMSIDRHGINKSDRGALARMLI